MNNYFKGRNGRCFFFNDLSIDQAARAFIAAKASSAEVSVFRVPPSAGPWDRASIIGHRSRGAILVELNATDNTPEDQTLLISELRRLDSAYFDAGRDTIPLQAVAA